MAHRQAPYTAVGDMAKALLKQQLDGAWSTATVAAEMQKRGHKGWTTPVVQAAAREARLLTVDEAIGLLGLFKGHAQQVIREIDKIAETIAREGRVMRP